MSYDYNDNDAFIGEYYMSDDIRYEEYLNLLEAFGYDSENVTLLRHELEDRDILYNGTRIRINSEGYWTSGNHSHNFLTVESLKNFLDNSK